MQKRAALIQMAFALVSAAEAPSAMRVNGFGNGMPGYLYNVGSGEYLSARRGKEDPCTMMRTTRDSTAAGRFKVQRAFYKGLPYNLVVSDSLHDVQRAATVSAAAQSSVPFYGYTVVSLLKERGEKYLRLSTDTDDTHSWMSFSPPFLKNLNAFKIYQDSRCWTVDPMGYITLEECTAFPKKLRNRQLFMWLPQNEYVSYMKIPVPTYLLKKGYLEKDAQVPEKVEASLEYRGALELMETSGLRGGEARAKIQSIGATFHPPELPLFSLSDLY